MDVHLNCGKCFKDTVIPLKEMETVKDLKCKCGNYLIKDGMMMLR